MSEHPGTEQPGAGNPDAEPASGAHPLSGSGDDRPAPLAPPRRRRRVARAVGGAVLACAVLAGVGATVVTVRNADRDPGKPSFAFPDSRPAEAKAPAPKGLAALLVPYGTGDWSRGPDYQSFGSDVELGGARAQALRKEELGVLPRTARRELEKEYDKHPVKGMALRSYLSGELAALSDSEGVYTATVILTRMDGRAQAEDQAASRLRVMDSLDVFRPGPAVKGHKDARCYLQPKAVSDVVDRMVCAAARGDLSVLAEMEGIRPLDTRSAATLFAAQLDRIAEPGEAV
ncbi:MULTISPECIES: hypothetical protein [Streptomyces]|uniref:Secreted protein n=1 Tax=Streptomyces doudnae TaxID=3075536 RepID=A0ABD5EVB1_9ACTN|nr:MULTISPECIES: hypothetical protein [unclassified Streptomyces]MDT0438561.1 hypothetical protein [Streptomyces sp. DSM 41981]SCE47165.1 hypothetical protein GA0115242_13982 [Streptomyces sp. SolWspMP-5a-2]